MSNRIGTEPQPVETEAAVRDRLTADAAALLHDSFGIDMTEDAAWRLGFDIHSALALLSAKDARIVELTTALEPFAMAATRQPIMAGRGSNTHYRTPADTDPFDWRVSWGDFRRALAASKGVET